MLLKPVAPLCVSAASLLADELICIRAAISLFGLDIFSLTWWEKQIPHWIRTQPAQLVWSGCGSKDGDFGYSGPTSEPTGNNFVRIFFPHHTTKYYLISRASWNDSKYLQILGICFLLQISCCLSLILNGIRGKKNRHLLDSFYTTLFLHGCENSSTYSSCTDSRGDAYRRWIYRRDSSLLTLCLFPWSLFIHDLMELHKTRPRTGRSVPLISHIISPGIIFYNQQNVIWEI